MWARSGPRALCWTPAMKSSVLNKVKKTFVLMSSWFLVRLHPSYLSKSSRAPLSARVGELTGNAMKKKLLSGRADIHLLKKAREWEREGERRKVEKKSENRKWNGNARGAAHKGLQQGNDTMLLSCSFPVAPHVKLSCAMCRLSNFDRPNAHKQAS